MNSYRITTQRLRRHIDEQLSTIDETLDQNYIGLISNINLQGRKEAFEEIKQLLDICEHDNYFEDGSESNFV
jgi:hypothetical protein